MLEKVLKKKKASYWISKLESYGVPVAKLNNIKEALELQQILDRNMIVDVILKDKVKLKVAGNPIKISNFKDKIIEEHLHLDQDRKNIKGFQDKTKMIFEYNLVALLTIIIGVIALFFFVIDKYPMESVSIGLLSALAIIQVIFPNGENNNISNY